MQEKEAWRPTALDAFPHDSALRVRHALLRE
jgi:hypothetical protein